MSISLHGLSVVGIACALVCVDVVASSIESRTSKGVAAAADTLLGHGLVAGVQFFVATGVLNNVGVARAGALSCLCAVVSVGMDADHFIAAGSLSMRGAMSLPSRPFAHCLAFLLGAVALAYALSPRLLPPWAPYLVATAFGGHQLRDSVKRGLWLAPLLGSLPPTPYYVYVCTMAYLPVLLAQQLQLILTEEPLLPL